MELANWSWKKIFQGVQTRGFKTDSLGRTVSETRPENGTTSYAWNDSGILVSKTDAPGGHFCPLDREQFQNLVLLHEFGHARNILGNVMWNGRSIHPGSPFLHRIGYMPAEPFIYDKLTGREMLRLVAVLQGVERVKAERETEDLAQEMELDDSLLDQLTQTYSRGTRRKLGLIASLLGQPDLLVMDEPTESLDPIMVDWLVRRLRDEAGRDRAILVSTHNLGWAESLCTHIAMLNEGRLLFAGVSEELRAGFDPTASLENLFRRAVKRTREGAELEVENTR